MSFYREHTFELKNVDWPNLITEIWFKKTVVELIPSKAPISPKVDQRFKFLERTDFKLFEKDELELVLKEKLAFAVADFKEIIESAANNPLPSEDILPDSEFEFVELLIHQIDVSFIVTLIDEILRNSIS